MREAGARAEGGLRLARLSPAFVDECHDNVEIITCAKEKFLARALRRPSRHKLPVDAQNVGVVQQKAMRLMMLKVCELWRARMAVLEEVDHRRAAALLDVQEHNGGAVVWCR